MFKKSQIRFYITTLCQSFLPVRLATLAKLIILIANRFCGVLCTGVLQTPPKKNFSDSFIK